MFIEKMKMETAFTFDDVLLEPAESWVEPDEADVAHGSHETFP